MARRSTITTLPPDILEKLQELLRDPRIAQLDAVARINEILDERGEKPLSKSAVNRYAVRMNQVGQKLQEAHAISDMWIAKFGRLPSGQLGQLIIQMVQAMAFDVGLKLHQSELTEDDMPGAVHMLTKLATMLERTERAASLNADRETEIREQARREAADAAEQVAKQGGLSTESVQELRRAILGVRT